MHKDTVTLAHGSGGELTNHLLEETIFKFLGNDLLNKRHDGALLDLPPRVAFTTDTFVVSPLFFPGGNIGDLAINGTVNDLAMCGAQPVYLSLSFILEEGFGMKPFTSILSSIGKAAEDAGVLIVTGDTKVVEKGKGDGIFINTSGIGNLHPKAAVEVTRVKEGDSILISGPVASHGMAIMSVRQGLAFDCQIKSDTRGFHKEIITLLEEYGDDIHLLRDPTRGGVATVLNEIARQSGLGMQVEEKNIPVNPQEYAACEMLGIDPLYVANEGVYIVWADRKAGKDLLKRMQSFPGGENASEIGEVTSDHAGKVVMKSRIGGRRILAMPTGEQLPRIC